MKRHFVPENEQPALRKELVSPSGKYRVVLDSYTTGPGTWEYSRGRVYEGARLIQDVLRNYRSFPFAWAEGHPNGRDYLLCGEDYQGYTVIELDTGARASLLPESYKYDFTYKAKEGGVEVEKQGSVPRYPNDYGFCWAAIHVSPDRMVLAVDGCYWAAPYEVRLYDFSEPMKLPYWLLERWDDAESFDDWATEGTVVLSRTEEVRKSDGRLLNDLPDDELDAAEKSGDYEDRKLTKLWKPDALQFSRSRVALEEYRRLSERLKDVPNDSQGADLIRDLMERPWFSMTDADRALATGSLS